MCLSPDIIGQYPNLNRGKAEFEKFNKETQSFIDNKDRLFDYIAWKYDLSSWESHLLSNELRLNETMIRISFLKNIYNGYFSAWLKLPAENRPELLYYKPGETDFLNKMDWSDPSIAFSRRWPLFIQESYNYTEVNQAVDNAYERGELRRFDWTKEQLQPIKEKWCELLPNLAPNLANDLVGNNVTWKHRIPSTEDTDTYVSDRPAAQALIGRVLPLFKSRLAQLLFIDRERAIDYTTWHSDRQYQIEQFSDSPDINFVIVLEGDEDTRKTEGTLQHFFPDTPILVLPTEIFLETCQDLRLCFFPGDVTINKGGQIFKRPLLSYDERIFKDQLKNLLRKLSTLK